MVRRLRAGARRCPEWIDPRVNRHAALATLGDENREWVVTRIHSLRPRQEAAPRLDPGGVERICLRAHLDHQRIQASVGGQSNDAANLRLLRVRT